MLIKNGSVFIDGKYHNCDVEILDGMITRVGTDLSANEVLDATGKLVYPGFIETHIHGGARVSVSDGEESVRKICAALPAYGITSFMPTPMGNTVDEGVKAVRGIRAAKGAPGADILGINFYSPFKNSSDRPDGHVPPTKEYTLAAMDNDLSDVKIILVAPELPGGMEWIRWAVGQGIIVMIGFTEGTTRQIYEAADNGATLLDHFYNGFPRMDHHVEGSTIGCLLEKRLYCQMNFDHVHVAEPFIRLAMQIKGVDKIVAVHDGSAYVGAADGEYTRGDGVTLVKKDGAVRNKETGRLVTGCNSYDENMRVALAKGYSLEDIGLMFAENAARMLGLKDRGSIKAGLRGDVVVMDQGLNVEKTIIMGRVAYQK